MFGQDIGQLAHSQLHPFDQRGRLRALIVGGGIQSPPQIVVNGKHIAGQTGAPVLFRLAPVTFTAFARVLGIGKDAHEAILHLVALCPKLFQLCRKRVDCVGHVFGDIFGELLILGWCAVLRHLSFTPCRDRK